VKSRDVTKGPPWARDGAVRQRAHPLLLPGDQEALGRLGNGDVIGRAVIVYD
jgi:hypothetical protein